MSPPHAAPAHRYAFRIDGDARRSPIRPRASIRRTSTRRARWSIRAPTTGTTDRLARPAVGRGGDLRVARRHVHAPKARSPRPSTGCRRSRELGITAIELMPVADFPGRRNWGYDGVLPFAPAPRYGAPEDLKRAGRRGARPRPDGAARRRLQPLRSGGQLSARYAPQFFTQRHHTPWGAAINFDGEARRTVRDFFIHNALYWLEEYHFDGLRLDAVHAIATIRAPDIVTELADAVRRRRAATAMSTSCSRTIATRRAAGARRGRPAAAATRAVERRPPPCAARADHRARRDGYYADYAERPLGAARPRARGGLCLPGRAFAVSRRRAARRALAPSSLRRAFVVFPANARPGRQPGVRRAAVGAGRPARVARGRRVRAALAGAADAVHGRGVRRVHALPVLLRLRARAGGRRHARPPRGVRQFDRFRDAGSQADSGPERLGDVRGAASSTGTKRPRPPVRSGSPSTAAVSRCGACTWCRTCTARTRAARSRSFTRRCCACAGSSVAVPRCIAARTSRPLCFRTSATSGNADL